MVVVAVVMVVVLGWERAVLERNKGRVEPISSSQVVKLKVCDPMTSQVDDQNGHLLTHLGKGNGNQVQWLATRHRGGWIVTAGWEQLVSTELQATHVPILQKKSPYTRWKCQELLRRFSTLLAAGAAGQGLALRLLALLFGPPVGEGTSVSQTD